MKLYNVEIYKAWSLQLYLIFTDYDTALHFYEKQINIADKDTYPSWHIDLGETDTNDSNGILNWANIKVWNKDKSEDKK